MRPWLLQIRPFVLPTDDRADLGTIAHGLTDAEYVDKIWALRYPGADPTRYYQSAKASGEGWPYLEIEKRKLIEMRSAARSSSPRLVKP
jgi:hypothetical protein